MTAPRTRYRFDADTQVAPAGDGRWRADVGDGWSGLEGRPNGGYLFVTALAGITEALDGAQPLTVTAHFLRPGSVGPAEVDVEVVRRGRTISTATASLRQDGTDRLRLLAAYASGPAPLAAGSSGFSTAMTAGFATEAPAIPGPDECRSLPMRTAAGSITIADRFDYRVTPTSRWIRGEMSGTAQLDGWIRFVDGRAPDLASVPLVVDAFPPVIYEVADGVVVPTVELTVHFRREPVDGWLQARVRSHALIGGMIEEDVELWDSAGQLVAMSRQLAQVQPIR